MARIAPESKICASCGRSFSKRRRYADNWDEVRYCSERCRRHKPASVDRAIEHTILAKLHAGAGSVCPFDVAREMFVDAQAEQLERVRQAARRLVARYEIEMIQSGRVVDPSTARGAIRLRLK